MKDFFPGFTFSFLMAQLFPGATAVLSLTCGYITVTSGVQTQLMKLFSMAGDLWLGSTRNTVVFLFLSTAVGMFLHGLSWSAYATMENTKDSGLTKFPFHQKPIASQLLLAPFNIIYELLVLLGKDKLGDSILEENAPKIDPTLMPNFNFIQDFYLYFSQFFAHMSYALLLSFVTFCIVVGKMGATLNRFLFLVLIYLGSSAFFLMGRIHFANLFHAETDLANYKSSKKEPTIINLTLENKTPLDLTLALKDNPGLNLGVSLNDKNPLGLDIEFKGDKPLGLELSTKDNSPLGLGLELKDSEPTSK